LYQNSGPDDRAQQGPRPRGARPGPGASPPPAPREYPEPAPREYPESAPRRYPESAPRRYPEPAPRRYPEPAPRRYPEPAPRGYARPAPREYQADPRAPRPGPARYGPGPRDYGPGPRQGPGPRDYGPGPRQGPGPRGPRPDRGGYLPGARPYRAGAVAEAARPQPDDPAQSRSGGATGNEHLTAMTGAVLLVLFAAEGYTILGIRNQLTLHFFLGMLLLGPVLLKAGSTIYRFFRYYTGSAPYKRKGPPRPLLRVLGPVIIVSTAGIFGSGIMLAVTGPSGMQPWLTVHRAAFIIWFGAMTIHVLSYAPRLPRLLSAEARGRVLSEDGYAARAAAVLGGRGVRLALLIGSVVLGLIIAMLTVHLAAPWQRLFGTP
jgi:hypothetical protein